MVPSNGNHEITTRPILSTLVPVPTCVCFSRKTGHDKEQQGKQGSPLRISGLTLLSFWKSFLSSNKYYYYIWMEIFHITINNFSTIRMRKRVHINGFPLDIYLKKERKINVSAKEERKARRANRGKSEERWPTAPSSGCRDDRFASPTDQGLLVSSARHQTRVDHAGRDASSRGGTVKKVNIPLCHRWHAEFRVATIRRTLRHALARRVSNSPRLYSTLNIYSR